MKRHDDDEIDSVNMFISLAIYDIPISVFDNKCTRNKRKKFATWIKMANSCQISEVKHCKVTWVEY